MTVLTVGVVATVVTAGAAAPVAGSAIAGIGSGIGVGAATATSATAAVAGSAGAGAAAGAITGAIAGVSGSAAATGAAVGSASAAAVASSSAGAAGLTAGIASGPVGWLVLGAEPHSSTQHHPVGDATFDCWKPIVRDGSAQPSSGKLLKDIFQDQRVKGIIVHESRNKFDLPELRLVNIWDEQFNISYLVLPTNNQLVAHAVRVA